MSDDESDMAAADSANGEGEPDEEPDNDVEAVNDTEERYGEDESPA